MKVRSLALVIASSIVMTGCLNVTYKDYPDKLNVYKDGESLEKVTRLTFIEFNGSQGFPEISRKVTRKLTDTLVKRGLFKLDVIAPDAPVLIDLDLEKKSPYTIDELAKIRDTLKSDAILFGQVTSFRQYPGSRIGVFMRLLDLKNGSLVWAVDDVWDVNDRVVHKRMKDYHFDSRQSDYADLVTDDVKKMSTSALLDFVTWDISRTLDPKYDIPPGRQSIMKHRLMRRFGRNQKERFSRIREDL